MSFLVKLANLFYLWAYSVHTAEKVESRSLTNFECQRAILGDDRVIENLRVGTLEAMEPQRGWAPKSENKLCPNPGVTTILHRYRGNL